jgi:hypothetical protein
MDVINDAICDPIMSLVLTYRYRLAILSASRSGGTGRRARLKIAFLRECGFDSHLRHQTIIA